jgi:type IV secretion system protein TrbL
MRWLPASTPCSRPEAHFCEPWVIEIVLAGLWMSLDATSVSAPFKKLLQFRFWIWFATSFPTLTKAFSDSLVQMGLSAGGQTGNVGLLLNPSRIAGMALDATQPLVQSMDDAGLNHLKDAFVLGLCYLIIMACFFIIACQVCLAVVEYYLIVALATCLIPFGISPHTRRRPPGDRRRGSSTSPR